MRIRLSELKSAIRKVIVESDQWKGVLPDELWRLGDYEDYRDSGIDLRQYSDEQLQMKIEQLQEEIEDDMNYMDDPQNQYDELVAPKENLINVIQDLLEQGVMTESHRPNGTILDLAAQPGGVHIDELIQMFGKQILDTIDRLQEDGLLYMEDDGTIISLRGY